MDRVSLSKIVNLRTSPLEHGAWEQAAQEEGIPLQQWIRRELARVTIGEERWRELENRRQERRREAMGEAREARARRRSEVEP